MKYTFAALALASYALGAGNSPLIPTNVSSNCEAFLNKLNTDTTLTTCVKPLIDASQVFSPISNQTASTTDINSVLGKVCATGTGCDDATLRTWLAQFSAACGTELNQGNAQLISLYDVLYVTSPLKGAVCSVDSSQNYCVLSINANQSTSIGQNRVLAAVGPAADFVKTTAADYVKTAAANLVAYIPFSKRFVTRDAPANATNLAAFVTPNATTYQNTNLPFLFLQPSMSKAQLCTPCTRQIFVSYIQWESKQPYNIPGGLNKSPILGGQNELYSAVNTTCGASFTAAIESEAGVGTAATNGALQRTGASAVATLIAGAFALVFVA